MNAGQRWRQGLPVALVSVALVTSACGSSSKSGAAGSGGTATTTVATTTTAAAGASSAAGGASTAPATTTAAPTSAAATTTVKATGGGDWCKKAADTINKESSVTDPGTDPASIKKLVQTELGEMNTIVASAPSAIKGDVQTVFSAAITLYQKLAADNYDFTKLSQSDLSAFDDPKIEAAGNRITAYVKTTCGIDLDAGVGASASS